MKAKDGEHVVYILGAGFSAQFGLPVMSNFMEKSKDMLAEKVYGLDTDLFRKVYEEINVFRKYKDYFVGDLTNIEEILSLMEMGIMLGGEEKPAIDFRKFIADVVNHYNPIKNISSHNGNGLLLTFIERIFNVAGKKGGIDPYFSSMKAKYSILSFNYDMLLENAISVYCQKNNLERKLWLIPKESDKDNIVTYLKLHGSADNPESIITPTWRKTFKNAEDNNSVWKTAGDVLRKANHIRIIGYSLPVTDSYLKYFLKWGAAHQDNLKSIDVICLDDHYNSVEKRYRDFIHNKLQFYNISTEKYLDRVNSAQSIEIAHERLFE